MDMFTLLESPLTQNMWTLRVAYFLIALTTVCSQKYSHRRSNDLSTGERFLNDVHLVTRGVQESALLQNKATIDAVSAVNRAGLGILGDLQKSNNDALNTFVDVELTKLEAIKAAKLVFLNMLASQIASITEEVENADVFDLLESPVFGRLVNLLSPLFSGVDSRNSKTATDTSNIRNARTQRVPKTAAAREYSSRYSTPSMQRPSSPATLFPLSYVSSLRSARKVSKL